MRLSSLVVALTFLAACGDAPESPEEVAEFADQIELATGSPGLLGALAAGAVDHDAVVIDASYGPVSVDSNLDTVFADVITRVEAGLLGMQLPLDPDELQAEADDAIEAALADALPVSESFVTSTRRLDCLLELEVDARIDDATDLDLTFDSLAWTVSPDDEAVTIELHLSDARVRAVSRTDIEVEVNGYQWPYCYAADLVDLDLDGGVVVDASALDITMKLTFEDAGDVCVDDCCTPALDAKLRVTDIDVRGVEFDAPSLEWDTVFGDFSIPASDVLAEGPEVTDAITDAVEDLAPMDVGAWPVEHGTAVASGVTWEPGAFTLEWGDGDGDLHSDCLDNCPDWYNPGQEDADGDGIGDPCDSDVDGDGVDNDDDLCPELSNPGQEDADGDGKGDACDPDRDGDGVDNEEDGCPDIFEYIHIDADGDGLNLSCDNCPSDYNPDQRDADRDGIGNACEADDDNDGVRDDDDNCPETFNPDQYDGDRDGRGRACDPEERWAEINAAVEAFRERLADDLVHLPEERFLPDWGCLMCEVKRSDYTYKLWDAYRGDVDAWADALIKDGKALSKDKYGNVFVVVDAVDAAVIDLLALDPKGLGERYAEVGLKL